MRRNIFNFLSHHVLKHSRHLKKCCLDYNLHLSNVIFNCKLITCLQICILYQKINVIKVKNEQVLIDIFDE